MDKSRDDSENSERSSDLYVFGWNNEDNFTTSTDNMETESREPSLKTLSEEQDTVTTHSYITMTNNINTKSPEPPVKTSSQEHDTVTEYGYETSLENLHLRHCYRSTTRSQHLMYHPNLPVE